MTRLNADGTPTHHYIDITSRQDGKIRLQRMYPGAKIRQSSDMFVVEVGEGNEIDIRHSQD